MPAIDRSRVEHVAGLARIALTDEELDRFTGQLQVVLEAIEQLKDVDTSAVPPSASVLPRTITETAQRLRSRDVSALELADAFLAAAKADPFNAWLHLAPEHAREQ